MQYGFVYIWYDRGRQMFYIGSHWGTEDDGYICSSNRMRDAYYRRPEDFKRRIIELTNTDRNHLYLVEQKWLDFIKPNERGTKYYNVLLTTKPNWTAKDTKRSEETKLKMSLAAKNRKPMSEETKEKIRQARAKQVFSKESQLKKSESLRKNYAGQTEEQKLERITSAHKWHEVPKNKKLISKFRSETNKRLQKEGKIGMSGKRHSPETLKRMSDAQKRRFFTA